MSFLLKLKVYFQKLYSKLKRARSFDDYIQIALTLSRFVSYTARKSLLSLWYTKRYRNSLQRQFKLSSDYSPLVTIIVPNYNHGKFLKERLETIYAQDYANFEVLLLDDNSDDESREILQSYLMRYSGKTRVVVNEINSGSGYKQWIKGISLAKGELIWIAESDDISESNFLSSLIPKFENEAVKIAFSNTVFFEESPENVVWDLKSYWRGRTYLSATDDWMLFDKTFIDAGMHNSNLIPNVSSTLFTKPSDFKLQASWGEFKFCGDWLFYVHQMSGGLVAYVSTTTNFYRVHDQSTIKKNMKSALFEREFEQVKVEIGHLMERPRVLFVLPGLVIGGGELFPFRMAQICEKFGVVAAMVDLGVLPSADKDFFLTGKSLPFFRPAPIAVSYFLRNANTNWDLVYSHHTSADSFIAKYRLKSIAHLVSLHGMYEELDTSSVSEIEALFNSNPPLFTYTVDKNLSGFSKEFTEANQFIKVSNFIPDGIVPKVLLDNSLEDGEINICLIARAIPGKGWIEAVLATKMARDLSKRNIQLHLFGSGPLNKQVKKDFSYDWLHVSDSTNDSLLTASKMQAGLFLSTYTGESMPLILMEFLAIGLPTVFTLNGLSRQIMTDHIGHLGIQIGEKLLDFDCESVAKAIIEITSLTESERQLLRARMLDKFIEFSEGKNMPNYIDIFQRAIESSHH
jgi:glycosyltransferase involved in cell wall biosynthesis